jgi:hypothetical protein
MSKRDDFKTIRSQAQAAGWTIKCTKKGEMFLAPDGCNKVLIHTSGGSDHRAMKNALAAFRRAGLSV